MRNGEKEKDRERVKERERVRERQTGIGKNRSDFTENHERQHSLSLSAFHKDNTNDVNHEVLTNIHEILKRFIEPKTPFTYSFSFYMNVESSLCMLSYIYISVLFIIVNTFLKSIYHLYSNVSPNL